ncbi:MAG: hypothetical protein IJL75_00715 [Eubacterium sp.]|nr:hypothetical protein [Eubacterium sp.]
MACFLVPTAEAIIVKAVETVEKKREEKAVESGKVVEKKPSVPLSRKFKWLTWLLVGGAVLLAFEHIWHGEVTPWFPFLTAMSDPADTSEMLHEMATVGTTMAGIITVVWIGMCIAADMILRRSDKKNEQSDAI